MRSWLMALRTAASLTAGERSALRNAHRLDPLPEGTWFNGSRYFTAFGDSSPDHPDMTRFIEEWVAEQNAEIAKENVALAAAVEASQASLLRVVSVECQVVASY
ncbi:Cilia/flagella specific MOT9 [Haematococcus lacustris]|uniref:Cilia/flagella specific MOT9 n=1 Tax=Haematococcus lacustris TaxID=44745 RepID=A0A6A0A0B7_HAELA|nr:Cilia/flagella specific MOT9 [Haematococcus lacustris]